jgi:hypothetical protein
MQRLEDLLEEGRRALDQFTPSGDRESVRWSVLAVMANRYSQYLLVRDPAYEDKRQEFERFYRSIYREVDERFARANGVEQRSALLQDQGATPSLAHQLLPYDRTFRSVPDADRTPAELAESYYRAFSAVTQPESTSAATPAELERWALSHGLLVTGSAVDPRTGRAQEPTIGTRLDALAGSWFEAAQESTDELRREHYNGRGYVSLYALLRAELEGPAGELGLPWDAFMEPRLELTIRELRAHAHFEQHAAATEAALAELWLEEGRERPGRRPLDLVEALREAVRENRLAARVRRLHAFLSAAALVEAAEDADPDGVGSGVQQLDALRAAGQIDQELYSAALSAMPEPVDEQEQLQP